MYCSVASCRFDIRNWKGIKIMASVIQSFIEYLGLNYQPTTFADLITWFILVVIGIRTLMFTVSGIFSVTKSVGKGLR